MEIWVLFFLVGLSVQQEANGNRFQYAYLRPASLKFVPLQLVDVAPVSQAKPAQDQPSSAQVAQKPYIWLRPAPVRAVSTAGDYGDHYGRPIKQSKPWYGAAIYELLPASVPKKSAPAANHQIKLTSGGSTPLIAAIHRESTDKKQPVREQKPWFGPLQTPADEPLAVAAPTPLIATLVQSEDKPVRGHKPWFGPPFLPADPDAPQVDPQPTDQEQPVRGHKPWFGPPFLPADAVFENAPVRASAVALPSPLIATLIQPSDQPVRGQKPWFGAPILSAEEVLVDDAPEVQPTAVVLPMPLIATLIQPSEQPVRGQKPWFGPPIFQAEGIVEESLEIQPSPVVLPSPLIATLIQEQVQPAEVQTEKPVRGHKPWFGPPFLPADPVKQPKPIIVDESVPKQPKPIIVEDMSAIDASPVSVPRPLIATLLPGEFPHVGAAQKPAVETAPNDHMEYESSARFLLNNGQSLITTTPVGGGPVTVFRPTTITVSTAPICLTTAGGGAGPAPPPNQPFPPPCPARKKRSEEQTEEFILVDGKKFSPSEVEKLLSTAKPNFEEFDEDRRAAAISLASLTPSIDEEIAVQTPSLPSSRTQRLLPGLLTVTSDLTIPVYAPNTAGPTSTVTINGACVPQCLTAVPQCAP